MQNKWFQIVINDPRGLPGENIIPLLQLFMINENIHFCCIDHVEGAMTHWFDKHSHTILPIQALWEPLKQVVQFDWADIFMFKKIKEFKINENQKYPEIINETDLTLRMVDDTYFYIYTPSSQLASILQSKYSVESCRKDYLKNLEYPY